MTILGLFFILTIAFYFIWWALPISINRYSDIKFGNGLIRNIEKYKRQNGLPKSNDWTTLKQLGFKNNGNLFIPAYQKINDSIYELTYIEGFDGPYLMWNSKERKWKISH